MNQIELLSTRQRGHNERRNSSALMDFVVRKSLRRDFRRLPCHTWRTLIVLWPMIRGKRCSRVEPMTMR